MIGISTSKLGLLCEQNKTRPPGGRAPNRTMTKYSEQLNNQVARLWRGIILKRMNKQKAYED